MSVNNCMNCGAMLLQGAAVCPVCQQPLAPAQPVNTNWQQQQPQQAPPVAPWPQQPYAPPGAGSTGKGLNVMALAVVCFAALLVVAGAVGAFVYVRNRAVVRVNKEREEIDDLVKSVPESPTSNSNSMTPKNRTNNSKPISGGVLNGKAISLPKPPYPAIAKAAHASGTVVVQVTVDEDGNVTNAKAVSGHPLLQASATQAARQARFTPTVLAGKPVKVTGVLTYNFEPQ
jgi:TonB family protein